MCACVILKMCSKKFYCLAYRDFFFESFGSASNLELSEKLSGKANGLSKKCHFEKSQWLLQPKKSTSHIYTTPWKEKRKKNMKLQLKLIVMTHDLVRPSTYPRCDSTNVYAKNNYTLIQANEIQTIWVTTTLLT